jgi:hypothetical protein
MLVQQQHYLACNLVVDLAVPEEYRAFMGIAAASATLTSSNHVILLAGEWRCQF